MSKRKDDDGFAEYCRMFAAAKVDFAMPFSERVARMLAYQAMEILEKEIDLGFRKRRKYVVERNDANQAHGEAKTNAGDSVNG